MHGVVCELWGLLVFGLALAIELDSVSRAEDDANHVHQVVGWQVMIKLTSVNSFFG